MAYLLSFSEAFYADDDLNSITASEQPTSVYQAILSIRDEEWKQIARDVFGVDPEYLDPMTVLDRIRETNTCSTCLLVTRLRTPTLDPPQRLPSARAFSCPALTRSPRTSVSYWATDARMLAMSLPAGVDKSSPSRIDTKLILRSRSSSKSAVRPFAVLPSRSIRQTTIDDALPCLVMGSTNKRPAVSPEGFKMIGPGERYYVGSTHNRYFYVSGVSWSGYLGRDRKWYRSKVWRRVQRNMGPVPHLHNTSFR